jgi:ABC-type branched-subunit amino acid transport system ATPase component
VSFEISPGEIVGLIGPNGAGKSTAIDAITGFVACEGNLRLDGKLIDDWTAARRARAGIGRSFQSLELFDDMTILENIRTACDPRASVRDLKDLVAVSRPPLTAAAVEAIRDFGLEGDLMKMPGQLSYGKRRLVAIARTVAAQPSILLLDEPAAGLSESESDELGRLLRHLATEWGFSVLLVEHDVSLVMRICDRIVALDFGRRIAMGTPIEVRHDPVVIAAYLGAPETMHETSAELVDKAESVPATQPAGGL